MTAFNCRVTQLVVAPTGDPVYSERAFSVSIEDESGGEFLVLQSNDESCKAGQIRLDPEEWPQLRKAINRMMMEIRNEND